MNIRLISPIRRIIRRLITKTTNKRQRILLRVGLVLIAIFLPVVIFLAHNALTAKGAWSPEHRLWSKRKVLTIKNDAPDSLASGTTVAVSVDTKTLAEKNDLQDDCDDLRVVYSDDGSTWTELDRYVSPTAGDTCGASTSTKVYFDLQEAISASSSSNPYYYMYYGNDKASTPTSTIDAFDTSSANALLVCPFDGDTDCINSDGLEQPTTETGAIRYSGEKTAMSFDGNNDYVTLNSLGETLEMGTLEFYINLSNDFSTGHYRDYELIENKISGQDIPGEILGLKFQNFDGSIEITLEDGGGGVIYRSNKKSWNSNTWYHVAYIWNGTNLKLFINGSLDNTFDVSHGMFVDNIITLGIVTSDYYAGSLDEIRISNIIRYTGNFTPQTSPFVRDEYTELLLHFDEGGDLPTYSGYAYDDSGNNNHGLITGAKYVTGLIGVDGPVILSGSEGSHEGHQYNQSYASHQGIFLEEGTTNLIKNPSFDHSTFNTLWGDEEESTVFNLSTASATFTPNMAKRSSPGPFTTAPIVQGKLDSTGTPDIIEFSRGSQIGGYFYENFDGYQGSVVFWVTPEWDGNDDQRHIFFDGGNAPSEQDYLIQKDTDNYLYAFDGYNHDHSIDISDWTAGTTYLVTVRFDTNNAISESNHVCITINNNATSCGVTTAQADPFGANGMFVGSRGDVNPSTHPPLAADAIIEGLTVYRRPLYDGTYGIDVGNGDEIEAIYNNGDGEDPTLKTGSWDVVFALPTNSSTGTLSTGTGEAWSHPHSSNLLTNGFFMDEPVFDGWSLEGSPSATGSSATAQKIFAGGGYTTSNSANEGIYQDITVSAGDDWVIRAIAHSDGTATPSAILYDQTNGAEIGSLTATSSASTRTNPEVFIFTGEAPSDPDCTTLRVKLVNTNTSGTVYWHQVEVLSNLISNPSFDDGFQGTNPDIPDDWNNFDLDSNEGLEENTIVHTGNSSFEVDTDEELEGIRYNPGRTVDKYYSFGNFMYESGDDIRTRINTSYSAHAYDSVSYNVDASGADWNHYSAIVRGISGGSDGIILQSDFWLGAQGYFDDVYFFQLDDVSLTVTPADEENSAEDWGIRVDGQDTLTQTISGLTATDGTIRFRYTPRQDIEDHVDFGDMNDYIVELRGDDNNYLRLRHTGNNTNLMLEYKSQGGSTYYDNYDFAGLITAGTSYEMEISYTSSGATFTVDDVLRNQVTGSINFSTVPTTASWGNGDGTTYNSVDAVFSDPSSNPGSGNITDTAETSAPYYKFGSKSTKLVAGANDYYTIRAMVDSGTSYALSVYVYDGTTGNIGGTVDNTIAQLVFEGENISGTTYTDMGGGWWRLSYPDATPLKDGVAHFGVYVLNNKTVYVDGVQLEAANVYHSDAYKTTYIDGSLGTGYSWNGTAHESTSSRAGAYLSYTASGAVNETAGAVSMWVYRPETYRSTLFFKWTSDGGNNEYQLYCYQSTTTCYFRKAYDGTSVNVSKNITISQWTHLVATWDDSNGIALYLNNSADTDPDTGVPNISATDFTIGYNDTPFTSKSIISDVRFFEDEITATEVADLYYSGLVSHSEGIEVERHDDAKGQAPVAVWHFDEGYGTTAYDSSMYGNNLTISDATPSGDLDSSNPRSMNLQFDGVHSYLYRNPTDSDLLFDDDSFSVSGWFKHPSSVSGTDTIISQYGDSSSGDAGGWKVYMNSSGYICAGIDDDNSWGPDDSACSSTSYADSSWHHFSLARHSEQSEESLKLYVDGQLVAEDDNISATGSLNNNASIYVGIDSDGTSNLWSGFLDEIIIYPYARSADQIKTDATGGPHQSSAVFGTQTEDWLTEGLVGYWDMEDNAESEGEIVTDKSGNGNDGTLYGDNGVGDNGTGMTATASGKFGTAAEFDGTDDYISTQDIDFLDGISQMTVSGWIKLTDSGAFSGTAISKGLNTAYGWQIKRSNNQGGVGYDDFYITMSDNVQSGAYTNADLLTLDTWTHVVMVFDGTKTGNSERLKFFVNGSQSNMTYDATIPSTTRASNSYGIGIGAVGNGAHPWGGNIDEVRIYNHALSPSEVEKLYNWAPGPVGYWKMDEGTGTGSDVVKDSSGNNNHGTTHGTISESSWVNGKYGHALSFNANNDDYIEIGNGSEVDNLAQRNFSFGAWIYPTTADSSLEIAGTWYNNEGWYLIKNSDNELDLKIERETTDLDINTSETLKLNIWQYVTFTWDAESENLYMYIDGIKASTAGTVGSGKILNEDTYENQGALGFASRRGYNAQFNPFNGNIDDVRIYNYVRTQEQIISDMNAGHPAPGSPVGSPIGYWKFDEGYGDTAYDSGTGGNDGDLAGSGTTCPTGADDSCPSWSNEGKFGKALVLSTTDTDDYIDLGQPDALDITDEITLSAWIKTTQVSSGNIIAKWDTLNTERSYRLATAEEGFFRVSSNGTTEYTAEGTTAINDDNWHHLVGVYDGSTLKLYVDSVLDTSVNYSSDINSEPSENIFIGKEREGSIVNAFDGSIDEVKIYNFALTHDQIKMEYNQGSAAVMGAISSSTSGSGSYNAESSYCPPGSTDSCVGPVAEWNFEESEGQYTYDTSENNNTGTLGSGSGVDSADPTWNENTNNASWALEFDGSNDNITLSSLTAITTPYTISLWMMPQELNRTQALISLRGSNTYPKFRFDGTNKLLLYAGAQKFVFSDKTWTSAELNQWWHVTFVMGSSDVADLKIYVNGEDSSGSTGANTETYYEPSSSGTIGDNNGNERFNGLIDQVRIYDYARTPAQIAWEYNRGAPVGHWELDECSGTVAHDSSGNGNSGTITISSGGGNDEAGTCGSGDTTDAWYNGRNGKWGGSLDFDGTDDYIVLNPDISVQDWKEITVSAWVNMNDSTSDNKRILSKSDHADSGYDSTVFNLNQDSSERIRFYVKPYDDFSSDNDVTSDTLTTGEWHHTIATWNGSTNEVKLYIDGDLSESITLSDGGQNYLSNVQTLYIGRESANPHPDDYFNGQIDDVKIFNYALTEEQIKTVYNNGSVRFGP